MSIKALIRKPRIWFCASVVLLVVAGGLWCYRASLNPERVFWGMIQQSLETNGVTVTVHQDNNQTNVHQVAQYSFGAANISHSITTLSQPGTNVKNEAIGTPDGDFTRYLSIKTDQKSQSGKPMDFSKVVSVWAKGQGGGDPQLFAQSTLGTGLPLGGLAVPIANLTPDQRQAFIKQLRNDGLYKINYKSVERSSKTGRLQFTYDAEIKPVAYARMMKQLAKTLGLHDFDQLDPASFKAQKAFAVKLTVDVHSRQLVSILAADGALQQDYSGYGIPVSVSPPTKAISADELQGRLADAQH